MAKFFMLALRVLKLAVVSSWLTVPAVHAADESVVVVGGTGADCIEDPGCVNRLHPDIPMVVSAEPGQTILFHTRDARDALGPSVQQTMSLNASAAILAGYTRSPARWISAVRVRVMSSRSLL